jgi:hypothetical protein
LAPIAPAQDGRRNVVAFGSLICCMTAHLLALTVCNSTATHFFPFNHHAEVTALTPKQQDRWLDRAEKNGLSVMNFARHSAAIGRTQAA